MSLDPHQLAAVESDATRLRVLAGAGAGKTRVLVHRALRLAASHDRVRLLTFTRAAASVIRARLDQAGVPEALRRRVEVDTHHGIAASILARHTVQAGLPERWQVLDQAEERRLRQDALRLATPASRLAEQYGLLTYDQLIPRALTALQDLDVAADESGGALLVDEAHDSYPDEWALDAALYPDSWTVVGDAAQRIYGWRGAADLLEQTAGWPEVQLPRNYRSGQAILDLANRLAIPGRVDLVRGDEPDRTGPVRPDGQVGNDQGCALRIRDRIREAGDPPEAWAVLARVGYRLEGVAEGLHKLGVPIDWPADEGKIWEEPAARHGVDLLHVVANPHDSLHLGRVLAGGGNDLHLRTAEAGRAEQGCSLWDWLCANTCPDGQVAAFLRRVADLRLRRAPAVEVLVWALEGMPLAEDLIPTVPATMAPAECLAWLADPGREPAEPQRGVRLGTIHSAKGLEWPHVVVLGLEEDVLPVRRRKEEERDEEERVAEERRLLYVALTRAKDHLLLHTSARRPGWHGRGELDAEPSRFWAELGLE